MAAALGGGARPLTWLLGTETLAFELSPRQLRTIHSSWSRADHAVLLLESNECRNYNARMSGTIY